MACRKIGLDLGYANITMCDMAAGMIREPSVALVEKNTGKLISIGNPALERESETDTVCIRPFRDGILENSALLSGILSDLMGRVSDGGQIRALVGLPSDYSAKEEHELFDRIIEAGAARCYGVSRGVAALVGAGYSPSMSVISVNVGASATEVCVLRGGKVILSSRSPIGGEDFDRAVKNYILEQGDVSISLSVARAIKERLGSVWEGKPSESLDITGTLSLTENRIRMTISSDDLIGVFESPLQKLLFAIADTVKKIPTDAIREIFENGIILSGGGAALFGLDSMIGKVLDIPTVLAARPEDCVCLGLSRIQAFMPATLSQKSKNLTASVSKYYEEKKRAMNK